ncbi:uncharacterized protein Dvir_GJ26320, isoform E [Drosophila virilis]|uniref:Uncharacterized protein, isoform A n=1 Tax=Drosophila virilis TaxID=7244 RepID=A0A0Q9WFD5_DROVI|nr:uncharacterized protein Dvir_GJ26320, isoform A [Drosophila virilis]KRF80030.1 uncharacterized protein Dvir_GJ26320, isoform B [Drosophila virilis]KRF80031.1 uncharacterized protein Dvir_GJ26320, isoform C [Drosophila virilis]KRF80032.1 uncharacterized protein Dvir_GJ26320, isoform D [Drosophila virilis]KRF80033.1 uncharacterized protein Dvir_GJ26320, isoform E [Drosophila virilis]
MSSLVKRIRSMLVSQPKTEPPNLSNEDLKSSRDDNSRKCNTLPRNYSGAQKSSIRRRASVSRLWNRLVSNFESSNGGVFYTDTVNGSVKTEYTDSQTNFEPNPNIF